MNDKANSNGSREMPKPNARVAAPEAERDALAAECADLRKAVDIARIYTERYDDERRLPGGAENAMGVSLAYRAMCNAVGHALSSPSPAVARVEAAMRLAKASVAAVEAQRLLSRHLGECSECDSVGPGCPQGQTLYRDRDDAEDAEAEALDTFCAAEAAWKEATSAA